jgi:hypothetical protein
MWKVLTEFPGSYSSELYIEELISYIAENKSISHQSILYREASGD